MQHEIKFINPTLALTGEWNSNVQAIKVIRQLTGMGLRQAKELVDEMVADPRFPINITMKSPPTHSDLTNLKDAGLTITSTRDHLLLKLKALAFEALELGEHKLSITLIKTLAEANEEGA